MQGHAPPADYRNLARHQESFNDVLYSSIRKTPWWILSMGVHAVLALALFNLSMAPTPTVSEAQVASSVEDLMDQKFETVEPVVEDLRPKDDIEPTEDPVLFDEDRPVAETNESDNDLPFQEILGDNGLMDSPFEGPSTNDGIGIGGGAGGAYPGRGGSRKMRGSGRGDVGEIAVLHGLEWLKNHQDPEGYWDCDGFSAQCKLNRCDGPGNAMYDPGVSGLALLAFLGAGETDRYGSYKDTVKRGLRYLKQIQDPEGCIGPRTTENFTYNHAIGALALTEAYGLTASPMMKQAAQSAIDFVHRCQNPYLAWRYGVRPQDNDTSVSGWMIMALKSAKTCGLRVDDAAFDGMGAWLEKVTEPEYGRVGYTTRGTGPARPTDRMEAFPADRSESLTAVGILSRIFLGEDPRKSETIQKGVDLCLKSLPVWDEASGAIDMYYWYYGTLALFQVGEEPFKAWNTAIREAVIDHQRKGATTDENGSWDPIGAWGREGGRVYSTALLVMCMEVYYRYPKVFGTR